MQTNILVITGLSSFFFFEVVVGICTGKSCEEILRELCIFNAFLVAEVCYFEMKII